MPIIIKSKRDGDDNDDRKRKAQSRFAHQTKIRKPTDSPSPFKPLSKLKSKEQESSEVADRMKRPKPVCPEETKKGQNEEKCAHKKGCA